MKDKGRYIIVYCGKNNVLKFQRFHREDELKDFVDSLTGVNIRIELVGYLQFEYSVTPKKIAIQRILNEEKYL